MEMMIKKKNHTYQGWVIMNIYVSRVSPEDIINFTQHLGWISKITQLKADMLHCVRVTCPDMVKINKIQVVTLRILFE